MRAKNTVDILTATRALWSESYHRIQDGYSMPSSASEDS